jgi:Uma2 family endonuclease
MDDAVLRPQHCILVVEVMSPGSITTDQLDKPAEYASGGIEHFWRVENCEDVQKLTVFRYRLDPTTRAYALTGASTGELVAADPLEVSVDFAAELLF